MKRGKKNSLKDGFRRLKELVDEIRLTEATSPSWWVNFIRGQVRLYFYIAQETVRNQCLQRAAALTFTTLLSLVPLLAVAFSFFRAFESLQSLERRAENAVLETMLAAPLVEGLPSPEESVTEARGAAPGRSGDELLKSADELPRIGVADEAARLYLAALERKADPKKIREGLNSLYYGSSPRLLSRFRTLSPAAQLAYRAAAGIPAGTQEFSRAGADHYNRATYLQDRINYEASLEEFKLAESGGYSVLKTRPPAARMLVALGDKSFRDGDNQTAVERYQFAVHYFADVLVLGADTLPSDVAREIIDDHNAALDKLGNAHQAEGRKALNLYTALEGKAPEAAKESLDTAIGHFQEAARYLERSAEAYTVLADALWSAGRQDEARKYYKKAAAQVKARGLTMAVADYIQEFTKKIGYAGIGVIGILLLIVTSTSLLNTIEKTFNTIWQVGRKRHFWTRFTSFFTLIWLGPALITASILLRETLLDRVGSALGDIPVLGTLVSLMSVAGRYALPFLSVWLALVLLYEFLPNTHVQFGAAAWGAFVGTVLIQIARPAFRLYVTHALKFERIYGSLGLIPIFLLWLWLMWLAVLFGAEVCFTVQNIGLLRFRDRLRRLSRLIVNRYVAMRILMYVSRQFWASGEPMSVRRLGEILQIPPEEAADAANRLVGLGLLRAVGEELDAFYPAKDLSKLKVVDVLSLNDRFRYDARSPHPEDEPYENKLEETFDSAIRAQSSALGDLTFRDLIEACEKETAASEKKQN